MGKIGEWWSKLFGIKQKPVVKGKEIGRITHYYGHLNVGIIELSDTLKVGVVDDSLASAIATAKSVRFFPYGSEILHAAPQVVRTGLDGVSVELKANTMFAKPGDNAR